MKRKRVYAPKRRSIKKRFSRRRRSKVKSITSKSGVARNVAFFKSKKTSLRAYRKHLWDSTLFMPHYRSVFSIPIVTNTNAAANVSSVFAVQGLRFSGNNFYDPAGGIIPLGAGFPIPAFNNQFTIRGGTIGLTLANDIADATSQRFKIYLVKTGKQFVPGAIPGAVQTSWDPSCIPDFKTLIGRVLLMREVILENVNSMDITYRLPVMKVDLEEYTNSQNTFLWIILANSPAGTASSYTLVPYYNISFSADTF